MTSLKKKSDLLKGLYGWKYLHLELLRKCSLFEKEQEAFHLRSHLDQFSVFYEKTLKSKNSGQR